MSTRLRRIVGYGLTFVIAACSTGAGSTGPPPSATATASARATATATPATESPSSRPTDDGPGAYLDGGMETQLQPGLYYIDPVVAEPGAIRVSLTIATAGWSPFLGVFKPWESGGTSGRVGVGVVDVRNLVADGCRDHANADPPIGRSVDALATALARLAPFRVVDPPTKVARYGYDGVHLTMQLKDVAFVTEADGDVTFTDCIDGEIWSWIAPPMGGAFYGYQPRDIEEFWLLDVAGTRVVIKTIQSADSPPEAIAEMRAVLESIRIEP